MQAERGRDLLERLRDLAVLAAIFVFFAGFAYRYYYLGYLGVPAYALPASIEETSAYGYGVFSTHVWPIVIASGIASLGWWVASRYPDAANLVRRTTLAIAVLALIASFPIVNFWAQQTAFDDVASQSHATKAERPLVLTFTDDAYRRYSKEVRLANQRGCLQLVAQSADRLYVWVKTGDDPSQFVLAVPIRDLNAFETPLVYNPKAFANDCSTS